MTDFDLAPHFVDVFALSLVVMAIVSFIKEHLWPELRFLQDVVTVAVALVVGTLLGLLGHYVEYLSGTLLESLVFGFVAGFLATGVWDTVTGLLAKRSPVR